MRRSTLALGTAATLALAAGSLALPTLASSEPVTSAVEADGAEPIKLQPSTYDPTRSLAPLVEAVEPAVVAIEVEGTRESPQVPWMFRQFLDVPDQPRPVRGEGSGFVISPDGLLVTNHHVIDEADTITVRFADGRRVEATLIGSDADNDVALLQLPSDRRWPYVELGDSDAARVGDWVVAVGNPLGLGTTVTTGIISGRDRNLGGNGFHAFLQTDAAINQGNSGGPLFGLDGKVLGMNTAIIQYANTVGFAVPSRTLERIVEDLMDDGEVQRGAVGIAMQEIDPDLASALGLDRSMGAMVTWVQPGLPGEDAGLVVGDVILSVDDEVIDDVNEAVRTIGERRPGDKVRLGVLRDGKERTVKVTLADRSELTASNDVDRAEPGTRRAPTPPDALDRLGVRLRPGNAMQGGQSGVQVLAVDPTGPSAGKLQPGDRIVSANKVPVASATELADVLSGAARTVLLEVRRGPRRVFVAVPLPDLDE